jgi:hypothetical protein
MFYADTLEPQNILQINIETHFTLRFGPVKVLDRDCQIGNISVDCANVGFHCSNVALDRLGKGEASARESRKEQERG